MINLTQQQTVWLAAVTAWDESLSTMEFNDWLEQQKQAGKFWGA